MAGKRFGVAVVVAAIVGAGAVTVTPAQAAGVLVTYSATFTESPTLVDGGIWVASSDGTGRRLIIPDVYAVPTAGPVLSPDASQVAAVEYGSLLVGSLLSATSSTITSCSCVGLRWAGPHTLLTGSKQGATLIDTVTHRTSVLPGSAGVSATALSPDLALIAATSPRDGVLTVRERGTGRVSFSTKLPLGHLDPREPVDTETAWSPDGTAISVAIHQEDRGRLLARRVLIVDARTSTVLQSVSDTCANALPAVQWLQDSSAVTFACPSQSATLRLARSGAPTSFLPFTSNGGVDAQGAVVPFSSTAVSLGAVHARATAAGQVTVTAAVPAADAGAEVTAGGVDYGRLLTGRLVVTGLKPSHSYAFAVTPRTWSGGTGPRSVVKVRTGAVVPTSTSLSAASSAVFGSKVSVRVRVTRADSGHSLTGRVVTLRASVLGKRATVVGHGKTNKAGYATFVIPQRDDTTLTATSAGDHKVAASASAPRTVLASIHLAVKVGKTVGGDRVLTLTLGPARLVRGVSVRPVKQPYNTLVTCFPTLGKAASSISCQVPGGAKDTLVPLGPELDYDGTFLQAGPSVSVTIPK